MRDRTTTGMRAAGLWLALAFALLILGAPAVSADDAPPPGGTLFLVGELSPFRGRDLSITAGTDAADGGWMLDVSLVPRNSWGVSRPGDDPDLTGQFALAHAGGPVVEGAATARRTPGGDLLLRLLAPSGDILTGTVAGAASGAVTVGLVGKFPPAPAVDHTAWYVSRATGLTAYVLLFLNVCLGLAVRTPITEPWLVRWRAFDLHQFTALLVLGILAMHVGALLWDQFISFGPAQLLVPFTAPYRPVPTALGIVGLYVLSGITASFYLRRWIGYRVWRAIHYGTFGAFALSLLHGITAGTDSGVGWSWGLYWLTGGIVIGLTAWRFVGQQSTVEPRRRELLEDF